MPISVGAESIYCSCITSAREFGLQVPYGTDARDLSSNDIPRRGGGILLQYGEISHLAVILGWDSGGFYIIEGNYKKCAKTRRKIPFDDKALRGFWSPTEVQTVEGQTSTL